MNNSEGVGGEQRRVMAELDALLHENRLKIHTREDGAHTAGKQTHTPSIAAAACNTITHRMFMCPLARPD